MPWWREWGNSFWLGEVEFSSVGMSACLQEEEEGRCGEIQRMKCVFGFPSSGCAWKHKRKNKWKQRKPNSGFCSFPSRDGACQPPLAWPYEVNVLVLVLNAVLNERRKWLKGTRWHKIQSRAQRVLIPLCFFKRTRENACVHVQVLHLWVCVQRPEAKISVFPLSTLSMCSTQALSLI